MKSFFSKLKSLTFSQWIMLIACVCLILITLKMVFFKMDVQHWKDSSTLSPADFILEKYNIK